MTLAGQSQHLTPSLFKPALSTPLSTEINLLKVTNDLLTVKS